MPDPNTPSVPPVWPPAPEGMQSSYIGADDIREFEYQNGWLLFLLLIVTLGIYAPFWMIRTSKTYNRIYPSMPVPETYAKIWLGLRIVDLLSAFVIGGMAAVHPGSSSSIDGVSSAVGWGIAIYGIVLAFMYRNALNRVIERTSPQLERIGGILTFFFGVLYLQICLNQAIKKRQDQVQQESMMNTPRT